MSKEETLTLSTEGTIPVSPIRTIDPEDPTAITLPDDAPPVEQVSPTDRLLAFDEAGDPVITTAEQVKEFATSELDAALAEKADKNGSEAEVFKAMYLLLGGAIDKGVVGGNYSAVLDVDDVFLMNWDETKGAAAMVSKEDPYFVRIGEWVKRSLWHSGNFDPKIFFKTDVKGWRAETNCDNMLDPGTYDINPNETPFTNAPFGMYGQIVVFRTAVAVAQIAFEYGSGNMFARCKYNTTNFSAWSAYWHSGNLTPASAASVGLMSAEDKIKLNSVASAMSLSVEGNVATTLEEDAEQESPITQGVRVRAQRCAQFQMQADELLYDALETFARAHPEEPAFAAWLEAKDRIRQELPKPTQEGGEE